MANNNCISCFTWANGGYMSVMLYVCPYCGKKNSSLPIGSLIEEYSLHKGISNDESYDLFYEFLREKQDEYKSRGQIYFDEGHFLKDCLNKFFS